MLDLYNSGWNAKDIAVRIGVSLSRVRQILVQLGYTPRSIKEIDDHLLRRLHAGGSTNEQLAEHFSVNSITIYRRLKKFGLKCNRKTKTCRPCSVAGCRTEAKRRGCCQKHYKRLMKYGDPLIVGRTGRPKQ